jgi:hypothetical protein
MAWWQIALALVNGVPSLVKAIRAVLILIEDIKDGKLREQTKVEALRVFKHCRAVRHPGKAEQFESDLRRALGYCAEGCELPIQDLVWSYSKQAM